MRKRFLVKAGLFLAAHIIITGAALAQWNFHTDYFKIHINQKGYITGMQDITVEPNREFSPPGKPSPLLCLYSSGKDQYYYPRKAVCNAATGEMILRYANGAERTWGNVRAANAFPLWVKKALRDASKYFHLEAVDANTWNLYGVNSNGTCKELFVILRREAGY